MPSDKLDSTEPAMDVKEKKGKGSRRTPTAGPDTPKAVRAACEQISQRLQTRIGPHKYEMWFGHTRLNVDGPRLEVATYNEFVAKWIDAHFADELKGAAEEALGGDARISVRAAPELFARVATGAGADGPGAPGEVVARAGHAHGRRDGKAGTAMPDAKAPSRPPARRGGGRRRTREATRRRLEDFVVGPSNLLAHSTACRLIESPDAPNVSPLFIHGDCGLGKTHLLQAICEEYATGTVQRDAVRYVTGEQFTNEYIASIRNNTIDAFRRRIRRLELLAIDDVHFLSNKMRTQNEFLHTLDAIALSGARIVLAADEHPRVIKKFSQALISRFLSGMVVEIDRPDRATRMAIVQRLAEARHLTIGKKAIEAVASRCIGSVRELEGAVTKLTALWSLRGELTGGEVAASDAKSSPGDVAPEVGMVLVDQLIRDHTWKPPIPVRIGTIIDVVCRRCGIARADLMGSSRHRRVVLGRALVAYLGRAMTTLSYPELARALGRKYHSTVHTAEQRLKRQMDENQVVKPSDGQPVGLTELVDHLRHEIARATTQA